ERRDVAGRARVEARAAPERVARGQAVDATVACSRIRAVRTTVARPGARAAGERSGGAGALARDVCRPAIAGRDARAAVERRSGARAAIVRARAGPDARAAEVRRLHAGAARVHALGAIGVHRAGLPWGARLVRLADAAELRRIGWVVAAVDDGLV